MNLENELSVQALADKIFRLKVQQRANRTGPRGSQSKDLILDYLNTHDGVTPSDLGKIMNVSMPRITRLLNQLEEDGYISRQISPSDRRQIIIIITQVGKQYFHDRQQKRFTDLKRLKAALTTDDFQALDRILDTINDLMIENDDWVL